VYEDSRSVYLALKNAVEVFIQQRNAPCPMDFTRLETLALLLVHRYDQLKNEQKRHAFLTQLVTSGISLNCQCCTAIGYAGRQSQLSLVKLQSEIFPSPGDLERYKSMMLWSGSSIQQLQEQNFHHSQQWHNYGNDQTVDVQNPAFDESSLKVFFSACCRFWWLSLQLLRTYV
jgi:hypothetical protein